MYKTRADLETENHRFRKALEMIKDEGRVCSNYELCHHDGCNSSYTSWAIADAALAGVLLVPENCRWATPKEQTQDRRPAGV